MRGRGLRTFGTASGQGVTAVAISPSLSTRSMVPTGKKGSMIFTLRFAFCVLRWVVLGVLSV